MVLSVNRVNNNTRMVSRFHEEEEEEQQQRVSFWISTTNERLHTAIDYIPGASRIGHKNRGNMGTYK
jgi:hypothetical protein